MTSLMAWCDKYDQELGEFLFCLGRSSVMVRFVRRIGSELIMYTSWGICAFTSFQRSSGLCIG